ncbi:MAG TPA: ATP-binding protein [Longimicrobium sp.]|jgi:AAA+ superfamily predicted ATPase/RecA/RadA recombinase
MAPSLTPVQQRALDELLHALRPGRVVAFSGGEGAGKTTVLRAAHAALGGAWLSAGDLAEVADGRHPLALEEAFHRLMVDALARHDTVLVDDFHLLGMVVGMSHMYPRMNWIYASLVALGNRVEEMGKRLVVAADHNPVTQGWRVAHQVMLDAPRAEDYRALSAAYLDPADVARLDFGRIFRFARRISARALRRACESLPPGPAVDTDAFVEHLRTRHLVSNVDLGEVQAVDLHDLKGVDDIIRALEANVILPLENAELAAEFGLRPKRGVLLAGPPGTGKTTVGRALAHRLRSKFFLVDGTLISGTSGFYSRLAAIFEAAKQNAPAVIFIDDSDVIFEGGGELGLYRYLLTMLDGLESESAGRVCLMMTAMDVGSLPPALVRSGRIELWLETRLPDEEARAAILADRCAGLPAAVGAVDVQRLAASTDGLTGADLARLVEDGKILVAYDRSRGEAEDEPTAYFLRAIETVRANKERYAEAEARARERRPTRSPMFDMMEGMGFAYSMGEVDPESGLPTDTHFPMFGMGPPG